MNRPEKCPYQLQHIPIINSQGLLDAQQVQPRQSQSNTDPDIKGTAFFQKQSQNRHQQNITCSQKTSFPGGCPIIEPQLLNVTGNAENNTAGNAAFQESFPVYRIL